jgi:hypothetical protein
MRCGSQGERTDLAALRALAMGLVISA